MICLLAGFEKIRNRSSVGPRWSEEAAGTKRREVRWRSRGETSDSNTFNHQTFCSMQERSQFIRASNQIEKTWLQSGESEDLRSIHGVRRGLVPHVCGGSSSLLGPEASPLRLLCSLLTLNQIRLFHVSDQISLLTVCCEHIEEFYKWTSTTSWCS